MAIERHHHPSFETGEVAEQFALRQDDDAITKSCLRLRNAVIKDGGAVRRAPGLAAIVKLGSNDAVVHKMILQGGVLIWMVISRSATGGTVRFYDEDYTLEDTIASSSGVNGFFFTNSLAALRLLRVRADNDSIILISAASTSSMVRFTRASASSWSAAAFSFASGVGGATNQPYYRFPATKTITLTPSAYTGSSKTLTASAALFLGLVSDVGHIFRLNGKEVIITSQSTTTAATITVTQRLYPVWDIEVGEDADSYLVGQAVSEVIDTTPTGLEGRVLSVNSGADTVKVQFTNSYDAPDTTTPGVLVGPDAEQEIQAASTALDTTPEAVIDWDEALFDPVGFSNYPTTIEIHRNRLCFNGGPYASTLFAASTNIDLTDFDVGDAADSDAIQYRLGGQSTEAIRHIQTADQLHLFTDQGVYYVPESESNPFSPTFISFLQIDDEGACPVCNPTLSPEGVLFANASGSRVKISIPTGNVRRSWQVLPLGALAPHLVDAPRELHVVDGWKDGDAFVAERNLLVVNDDGTMAVMRYQDGLDRVGWGLWEAEDADTVKIISAATHQGETVFVVEAASGIWLCRADYDARMWAQSAYSSAVADLDGDTCVVMENALPVGRGVMGATTTGKVDDAVTGETIEPAAGLTVGLARVFEAEPTPWFDAETGFRPYKYAAVYLHLQDAEGVALRHAGADGNDAYQYLTSRRGGVDATTAAPPRRDWIAAFHADAGVEMAENPWIAAHKSGALNISDRDEHGNPQMCDVTLLAVTAHYAQGGG